jgi:hypothetical protein
MRLSTLSRHPNPTKNPLLEFVRLTDFIAEATPFATLTDATVNLARMELRLNGSPLPEAVYGATEAGEALDALSRSLEEAFGTKLIAMTVWGRSKSLKNWNVNTDYKVGALCEDEKGARRLFVARNELPKRWGSSGEAEFHMAAWAIENKISWVKRDGAWTRISSRANAQNKIVVEHPDLCSLSGAYGVREGECALARTVEHGLRCWKEKNEKIAALKNKVAAAIGKLAKPAEAPTREERLSALLPDSARDAGMDFERHGLAKEEAAALAGVAEKAKKRTQSRRDGQGEAGSAADAASAASKSSGPRRV